MCTHWRRRRSFASVCSESGRSALSLGPRPAALTLELLVQVRLLVAASTALALELLVLVLVQLLVQLLVQVLV